MTRHNWTLPVIYMVVSGVVGGWAGFEARMFFGVEREMAYAISGAVGYMTVAAIELTVICMRRKRDL